jgi:hypothetical protein
MKRYAATPIAMIGSRFPPVKRENPDDTTDEIGLFPLFPPGKILPNTDTPTNPTPTFVNNPPPPAVLTFFPSVLKIDIIAIP